MLELQNSDGYVMWNEHDKGVERICVLYIDGVEIDPMEIPLDQLVDHAKRFLDYIQTQLANEKKRDLYWKNLPSVLQIAPKK